MRYLSCATLLAVLAAAAFGTEAQAPIAPRTPVAAPPVQSPAGAPVPANAVAGAMSATGGQMHPLTADDLQAFFDGIFPLQLERSDIAGATVLVMKDGNIVFEKGYGFADVKSKKPVDPANTMFRIASISKLFTWVSVMQLAEQGKLDIDTDVNRYLDFQIRPAFSKPVTLRNLMTHTGGFEEVLNDIIVLNAKDKPALRDYLVANQPRRLFPPGQVTAYSNYGIALASYIVQRASGEPFEQYAQEHIFAPLKMTHSSFYQPVPKTLEPFLSEGYRGDTAKPAVGYEFVGASGPGGLSTTASDMGRFGHALLNGGELDGARILKPETLARMWSPQYQANPQMPPICMGFYQDWRNGLHWIGHEGDLIAFHSLFFVEPTQKLVLFVSYNSSGGGARPRPEVIDFFSDRYFPGAPAVTFIAKPTGNFRDIAGRYQSTRRADSTKLRLMNIGSQVTAKVDKDNVLTIGGFNDLRGHQEKFKLIGTDLWQAQDEQDRVFAIRDGSGHVVRLAMMFPGIQFERVPWYANNSWTIPGFIVSLVILGLVFLTSLIRLGRRLFFRRRPRLEPQTGTIWLTFGPRSAAFVWFVFLGGAMCVFLARGNDQMPPTPAWFPWFVLINWLSGFAIFLSIFAVLAAIRIWFRDELRWITKVKFNFVGLACLFLSWFAVFYRLIGPAHRL
ncbi:MAG TPA: serine hydrolase domain-containing protein [Terracidiphilus sp.]|jgi:CubicO group peptidase (beta-lactamase class C family)|nr:serine hydrolase domain-containing protein [Terracidiphilus sp.]